jgi:hypothetical protein
MRAVLALAANGTSEALVVGRAYVVVNSLPIEERHGPGVIQRTRSPAQRRASHIPLIPYPPVTSSLS